MLRAFANGVWFTAAPVTASEDCEGCIFQKERSRVCDAANHAAKDAGLPECVGPRDVSVCIYVRDPSDGRQADLLIGGEA